MIVEGVVNIIKPMLEQLSKNLNTQMLYLTKQGDAFIKFFESKLSPSDTPPVKLETIGSIIIHMEKC